MNNAATAAPAITYTTAIRASDLSPSTDDVNRNRWTTGKLRYLVAALDGAPVAVTTDTQTGHTEIGVTLVGTSKGRLHVQGQGPRPVAFHDFNIGATVIPLVDTRAKWTMVRAWMDDASKAIRMAKAIAPATCDWGKWTANVDTATPGGRITVSYHPSTGNEHFADRWGQFWYTEVNIADYDG